LYHPLSQRAGIAVLISLPLMIVSFLGAIAIDNRITLEKRANSPSFWVRNREDFAKQAVTAGISALMGGLVGWFIGHFHK
jgi:membrane protein YqaA with SNARE-associated domain